MHSRLDKNACKKLEYLWLHDNDHGHRISHYPRIVNREMFALTVNLVINDLIRNKTAIYSV